ncbi:hypothetical protein BN424_2148 [Carnobacterium maltaromaticum LMA28]|uniref:Uncharacterized protein n=1 Tax=Carnobacterium maltaromaticum LMA28 TaxID=1234679 RepID=K8EIB9_CARML|nr:hypothetical protein [Carnobacterium maltaromaticum]CCO11588.2 hypothetical protein BN424_2148 [Carnobacterium maltaromaticum LMA28]
MDSYVVAACIALFGVFVSITGSYITNERITKKSLDVQKKLAKENINANLVAKARIEWIQSVREESASFITLCSQLLNYSSITKINLTSNEVTSSSITLAWEDMTAPPKTAIDEEELPLERELLLNEIALKANLLIIYFGPDDSGKNDDIINKIQSIIDIINMENYSSFMTKMENEIMIFRDEIRVYLKEEWIKAKKGI